MHVFICLTTILTLANISSIDTFVVTRYDSRTITDYYDRINGYYSPFSDMERFFQHQNWNQFCRELRESRFFDMTNRTDTSYTRYFQYLSSTYTFDPNRLEMEADRLIFQERHRLHDNRIIRLPTFRCMDPKGRLSRAIAPGFVPNTALMSTCLLTQQDTADFQRENQRRCAILIAIIDASVVLLKEAPNFNNFMEARRGLQRDPLCDLKKLLKFRLCAAASIGLGPVIHRYEERHRYNLYYQPENDDESCQYLEGIDQTSGRYPKMLRCSVKFTNSIVFKSFYLSLDVLQSKNVLFIRRVRNGSQFIYDTQYFYVPVLEHLEFYEEAFENVNI